MKATGEDGLPIHPYAIYNIGGGTPENLLTYISTLQEELVRANVLPEDYNFEGHRELVGIFEGAILEQGKQSQSRNTKRKARPQNLTAG